MKISYTSGIPPQQLQQSHHTPENHKHLHGNREFGNSKYHCPTLRHHHTALSSHNIPNVSSKGRFCISDQEKVGEKHPSSAFSPCQIPPVIPSDHGISSSLHGLRERFILPRQGIFNLQLIKPLGICERQERQREQTRGFLSSLKMP